MQFQNPYPASYQNLYSYVPESHAQMIAAWVQGVENARAFMVPRGVTAILIDPENKKMYIKETDESGRPKKMLMHSYTPEEEGSDKEITIEFLEERLQKMKQDILDSVRQKGGKNEQQRN